MALGQATGAVLRVDGAYYLDVPLRVAAPAALLCWWASGFLLQGAAGQNGAVRPGTQAELTFAAAVRGSICCAIPGNTLWRTGHRAPGPHH